MAEYHKTQHGVELQRSYTSICVEVGINAENRYMYDVNDIKRIVEDGQVIKFYSKPRDIPDRWFFQSTIKAIEFYKK
jgi:hypothetical protein